MARDPEVARAVERHRARPARFAAPTRACSRARAKDAGPRRQHATRRSSTSPRDAAPAARGRSPAIAGMGRGRASLAVGLFVGMLMMREPAASYASVTACSSRAASSTRRWIRSWPPRPPARRSRRSQLQQSRRRRLPDIPLAARRLPCWPCLSQRRCLAGRGTRGGSSAEGELRPQPRCPSPFCGRSTPRSKATRSTRRPKPRPRRRLAKSAKHG